MSTVGSSSVSPLETMTVMQALIAAFDRAASYNQNVEVRPAAILWTDQKQQWLPLLPFLRDELPHLLTFGTYDPATRTGPAIWLKCMIAQTLPDADWSDDTIPILYLPDIARQDLRAIASCPWLLQPLAELQYRGVFWTHPNGRDWSVLAFLKAKEGLGLDVAEDQQTLQAMLDVLPQLAETSVAGLQHRRLEAADFNKLLMQDPVRDLLLWLSNPQKIRQQWDGNRWAVFCNVARDTYKFDPQADGELVATERFAQKQKDWAIVWNRFAESPKLYSGIPSLLEQVMPKTPDLFTDLSSYPQHNRDQEAILRTELTKLQSLPLPAAVKVLRALEQEHGQRRQWIWAKLDQAPLAQALAHLTLLADAVQSSLGGSSPQAMADQYVKQGWQADAAVLQAIATVERESDIAALTSAIQALYKPWLEQATEHLQSLLNTHPYPYSSPSPTSASIQKGECLLFADGLRFDMGQMLKTVTEEKGWTMTADWQWTALPDVTATCKPAVSPIAHLLQGSATGEEFCPEIAASQQSLNSDRFIKLLEAEGIQHLAGKETGDPRGKAWTECGEIDRYGHKHGHKLAHEIPRQVRQLALRIEDLLNAGWQSVRIVTDHGWLLLPGGLPKQDLPAHLTQTRWGRCAVLKHASYADTVVYPWFWSADVQIAMASGIRCHKAGLEYVYGGISLQECIVPLFTVSGVAAVYNSSISAHKWLGMRCRITIDNGTDEMKVDIRRKPADASTSLAMGGKKVSNGNASLAIEDDSTEGEPAVIVLLDDQGNVIAKQATMIGGDA